MRASSRVRTVVVRSPIGDDWEDANGSSSMPAPTPKSTKSDGEAGSSKSRKRTPKAQAGAGGSGSDSEDGASAMSPGARRGGGGSGSLRGPGGRFWSGEPGEEDDDENEPVYERKRQRTRTPRADKRAQEALERDGWRAAYFDEDLNEVYEGEMQDNMR